MKGTTDIIFKFVVWKDNKNNPLSWQAGWWFSFLLLHIFEEGFMSDTVGHHQGDCKEVKTANQKKKQQPVKLTYKPAPFVFVCGLNKRALEVLVGLICNAKLAVSVVMPFYSTSCRSIFKGQMWEWYQSSHLAPGKTANKHISQNVKAFL